MKSTEALCAKLQALRHGNESVTVAVLQEHFCLSLNESTEALNLQRCLINKGAAFYMSVSFFLPAAFLAFLSKVIHF